MSQKSVIQAPVNWLTNAGDTHTVHLDNSEDALIIIGSASAVLLMHTNGAGVVTASWIGTTPSGVTVTTSTNGVTITRSGGFVATLIGKSCKFV